jgi:hypothetical protein
MSKTGLIEIINPDPSELPTIEAATTGPYLLPQDRVKLYSADDWETFIEEWAFYLKKNYSEVVRCSGAGDKGRDVVAFIKDSEGEWINYQCKHYDHPLYPSDIWIELGKLCYYTFIGEFSLPKKYFFVAPLAAGPALSNLIRQPTNLKKRLFEEWDGQCKENITSEKEINMSSELKVHIESIDFSIFKILTILNVVEQHRETPYHVPRFGGGLPPRPEAVIPELAEEDNDALYAQKLLRAYEEHTGDIYANIGELEKHEDIEKHFFRSRTQFFCAEALRNFSRDNLPEGSFEALQNQFYDGVIDTVESEHPDGFIRVKETVSEANKLEITNHPLTTRIEVKDRGGICHQLADADRLSWVKEKK